MRILLFVFFTIYNSPDLKSQQKRQFETQILIPTYAQKDQESSGTCWSFATTSFLETEALRLGQDSLNLSPMFYVPVAYLGKAKRFIESQGESWFAPGDLSFSVMDGYRKHGAIPESVYNGRINEDWQHDHLEMDNLILSMMESIALSGYDRIKPNSWFSALEAALDAYLGTVPKRFDYDGKRYTPMSFAAEKVGIKPDDYLEITSFSHLPFYEMSVLNIPANWNESE